MPKDRGLTFYQVLTLPRSSSARRSLDEERPLIAGVYQNRLDKRTERSCSTPTRRSSTPTTRSSSRKLQFEDWTGYVFWAPPGRLAHGGRRSRGAGRLPDTYVAAGPAAGPDRHADGRLDRRGPRAGHDKAGYLYFVAIPDGGGKHAFAKTSRSTRRT